jgi:hypothetical protein
MAQAAVVLHIYEPDTPRSAELLAAIAAKLDLAETHPGAAARHVTVPVQIEEAAHASWPSTRLTNKEIRSLGREVPTL